MKNSGTIIRQLLLFLLVCFCISGYALDIVNGKPLPTKRGTQKDKLTVSEKEFIISSLIPDQNKLVNEGSVSTMRLDSIYEDCNVGSEIEKRKWIYHYDNNRLISLDHFYYSTTYDEQLNIREAWYYNKAGQVSKYEEKDKIITGLDSLITSSLIEYTYENGNLVLEQTKSPRGWGSGMYTVNGESVIRYYINFYEESHHYLYNEKNLLIKEFTEGGMDTTYSRYDSLDRLHWKIQKNIDININYMSVEKHDYEETGTTKYDTKKWIYFHGLTDDAVIDTISTWSGEYSWDHTLNEKGNDSILIYTVKYLQTTECQKFKTYYEYSPSGQVKHISIYYGSGTATEEITYSEQSRIDYTYDNEGNLLIYHRTYYDDSVLQSWETEELKTYYYSSTEGTTANKEMRQNEFQIYPNPATDFILLRLKQKNDSEYTIYNLSGEKVKEGVVDNRSITIADLKKGTYFIRIYNNTTSHFSRFLKN
jgi:hypothetical protein